MDRREAGRSDVVPTERKAVTGVGDTQRAVSRREFLVAAASVGCASAAAATAPRAERVLVKGVDRFRVAEPNFEGLRILLNHRGASYSPGYIQGISGAAFRIAGICPCAADCSTQMSTKDLVKLLGYECTEGFLGWTGDVEDAKRNMVPLIPRIKDSLRAGHPVLLWYGFADTAYEVVTGFDDGYGVFLGRHMWQKPRAAPARAAQTRAEEAARICPAFGALFLGDKTSKLDDRAAELAALKEAVRHAHDATVSAVGPARQGLACYDHWVEAFRSPDTKRGPGDAYCCQVYRSTHRAASAFLGEISRKHPSAASLLASAAREFHDEADELDKAEPLMNWKSPEIDSGRNARLWPILQRARDHYAAGIGLIERSLVRF